MTPALFGNDESQFIKLTDWIEPATRNTVSLVTSGRNKFNSDFLFALAGFLDKNNDLLFRNLKEVTFTRPSRLPCFQDVLRTQSRVFCVCR